MQPIRITKPKQKEAKITKGISLEAKTIFVPFAAFCKNLFLVG